MTYYKFSEIIEKVIDNRGRNPEKYFDFEKYPVIDNFMIKNTYYPDLSTTNRFLSQQLYDDFLRGYIVHKDLLMTLVGNGIGSVTLAPIEPAVIVQNTVGFRINTTYSTSEYLYYYFTTIKQGLRNLDRGSSQPSINRSDVLKIKLELPSTMVQNKIVDILSKYDELIELNNKRIRLLEQTAEELYKEWFVRFRFPNYQNAEFENGIPKNWEYKKLNDVANILYGYSFASDKFCDDESLNGVVRIRDIPNNKTNTYTDEICDERYLIPENSFLIGMDGIFHMCLWNGGKAYLNQRVVSLNSKVHNMCNYILYFSVCPQVKFWEQVISGTTVAHLGAKHLDKIMVLVPTNDVLDMANEKFKSIMNELSLLKKNNDNLIKQRDLLLPRLMSGKLEVK